MLVIFDKLQIIRFDELIMLIFDNPLQLVISDNPLNNNLSYLTICYFKILYAVKCRVDVSFLVFMIWINPASFNSLFALCMSQKELCIVHQIYFLIAVYNSLFYISFPMLQLIFIIAWFIIYVYEL